MSTRAFIAMLFGKPELLNFINEAIKGSESFATRVNKFDVSEEVVVPVPGLTAFASTLPLSLSYSPRLSLKSESKNPPPTISSFLFCKAAAAGCGTGRAGGATFAIVARLFGRTGGALSSTNACFAIFSFCSFCLFCSSNSFSYSFRDFCRSLGVSVYSLL